MANQNYIKYLRSLVSEETSSDEESDSSSRSRLQRKRKSTSTHETETESKSKRKDTQTFSFDEDDPQEGTSRGIRPRSYSQQNLESDPEKRDKVGNIFEEGTTVFTDNNVTVKVKSVQNQRNTRFRTQDHLYQINIEPRRRTAPLLLTLERAIHEALVNILLKLKTMYAQNLHHQIYLTIIERNILHGLNTGNFDINTASNVIINRVMTILHSYLKSKQTLRLNNSFKIQIKVLSHRHTQHLISTKPQFKKHVYRDFSRSRVRN